MNNKGILPGRLVKVSLPHERSMEGMVVFLDENRLFLEERHLQSVSLSDVHVINTSQIQAVSFDNTVEEATKLAASYIRDLPEVCTLVFKERDFLTLYLMITYSTPLTLYIHRSPMQ